MRAKDLIRKLLNPEVKYRIGVQDVHFYWLRMVNQWKLTNGLEESTGIWCTIEKSQHLGFLFWEINSIAAGLRRFLTLLETRMTQSLLRTNTCLRIFDNNNYFWSGRVLLHFISSYYSHIEWYWSLDRGDKFPSPQLKFMPSTIDVSYFWTIVLKIYIEIVLTSFCWWS